MVIVRLGCRRVYHSCLLLDGSSGVKKPCPTRYAIECKISCLCIEPRLVKKTTPS